MTKFEKAMVIRKIRQYKKSVQPKLTALTEYESIAEHLTKTMLDFIAHKDDEEFSLLTSNCFFVIVSGHVTKLNAIYSYCVKAMFVDSNQVTEVQSIYKPLAHFAFPNLRKGKSQTVDPAVWELTLKAFREAGIPYKLEDSNVAVVNCRN